MNHSLIFLDSQVPDYFDIADPILLSTHGFPNYMQKPPTL